MTKNVLLLTSDAGFGHRAAANAIAAALAERYGQACRVAIVNPLDDPQTPAVLRRVESDYDRQVLETPDLYQLGYRASDKAFPVSVVEQALIAMLGPTIRKIIQSEQPDVVITTHPLYQAPVAAIFAVRRTYVPLITVVTDLATVHGLWFNDEVDWCLVPSRVVQEKALQYGLTRDSVELTGLPVNPLLARRPDKAALQAELGLDGRRVVALCAGSKRVTRLEGVVDALNHSGWPLELLLVAGGNEGLLEQWRHTRWHQPAHVLGFVPDMPRFIQAADFIVCKAGGLIVSEAMAASLPLLLIEAIPGQETGNADYVVQGGAGELAEEPLQALTVVCHWLDNSCALLAERASNSARLGHPYAAYRVAEIAWQAAQQGAPHREHRLRAQVPLLKQLLKERSQQPTAPDRHPRRSRLVRVIRRKP
jgi:1,2-diacylglycerol 3-beta-galactosyltransferase